MTPDDAKVPPQMAEAMFEAMLQNDLEAISHTHSEGAEEVAKVVKEKYKKRLFLYREGKKQWDSTISVMMVLRGIK